MLAGEIRHRSPGSQFDTWVECYAAMDPAAQKGHDDQASVLEVALHFGGRVLPPSLQFVRHVRLHARAIGTKTLQEAPVRGGM